MITAIRRSFKSRIYKIVLWIVLLGVGGVFSVFELFKNFFSSGTGNASWVLRINNDTITLPEFARSVADQQERIRIMRAQYGQYADLYFQMMGLKLDPKELAASTLITRTLLNQAVEKMPLRVSSSLAESQLNNIMLIQQEMSDFVPLFTWDPTTGGINRGALYSYLNSVGISSGQLDAELARGLKRDTLRKLVEHSSYTPSFEIKEQFNRDFLGHKFSIITISPAQLLEQAKKQAASQEQLKAYFDLKNSQENRYKMPEKRSAKIVAFNPLQYGISVAPQDIETYYNNNKAQYVEQPAQITVRRILLKVSDESQDATVKLKAENLARELKNAPATFAKVAKEHSQDSQTAASGGLMPAFSKGKQDPVFERAAFVLKEDNDISPVIKTKDGYEIVQRVSKKMQTFKPLDSVSKAISDQLMKNKFAQQFSSDVRAAQSAGTLAQFIKNHNGKESTLLDQGLDDSIRSKTLFKTAKDQTSFYQDAQEGVLVTTTAIKPSALPPFETVKQKVQDDYYQDQAQKNLETILESARKSNSLPTGYTPEKTGLLVHSFEHKEDQKEKDALIKKGIELGKLFQIENVGAVAAYGHNGTGYLIRLDERAPFNQALFDQKRATVKTELEQQRKSFTTAGFVASLYRNATISKNESQIHLES